MSQQWIDFKALRRELNFEHVLVTYGAKLNFRDTNKGRQHSGQCPLPGCKKGTKRKAFSANLDQGIWQAFCCRRSGNVLDFIVICEGLNPSNGADIRKAAEIAQKRFLNGKSNGSSPKPETELPLNTVEEAAVTVFVNAPLDFELKSLDPEHPWFEEHGLSKDTVKDSAVQKKAEEFDVAFLNLDGGRRCHCGSITSCALTPKQGPYYHRQKVGST